MMKCKVIDCFYPVSTMCSEAFFSACTHVFFHIFCVLFRRVRLINLIALGNKMKNVHIVPGHGIIHVEDSYRHVIIVHFIRTLIFK